MTTTVTVATVAIAVVGFAACFWLGWIRGTERIGEEFPMPGGPPLRIGGEEWVVTHTTVSLGEGKITVDFERMDVYLASRRIDPDELDRIRRGDA